ncbi:MAG TPA: multicopper oxidase family protein [Terriglobia bacterium]|nr:multicopper oxidase family protein [Terriglobia bacterium]
MSALTRRHFLAASAATGLGIGLAPLSRAAADTPRLLEVTTRVLEVNGKAAKVFALGAAPGVDGKPGFDFVSGDRFKVKLLNRLDQPTLVHWHGLTPPNAADGVPDMTQPALAAGASYDYDFVLSRPGTNFMHSHYGLQEQQLLAAPLIIRDPAEAHLDEQEVVIQLHDFTFREPQEILAELQKGMAHRMGSHDPAAHTIGNAQMQNMPMEQMQGMNMPGSNNMDGMDMSDGEMGQMPGMSHGGAAPLSDTMSQAMAQQMAGGPGANGGGMTGMDLNDVSYDAFLANDRTYQDPDVVAVERGGKVRLRLINAGSGSNFMIDLGALYGDLIAVDGMPVQPVSGRQFALAMGQRIDLRLRLPAESAAWPIVAQLEGDRRRSAVILAAKGAAISKLDFLSAKPTPRFDQLMGHLVAARDPLPPRPADRRLVLDLTGDMMRYRWGLASGGAALQVKMGERVEIEMVNRTAMSHPMHLHGHHFQLVAVDGKPVNGPLRDTHLVPAGGRCTIAFDADNPGRWAFHCHNLYHMAAGMMAELSYA